MKCGGTGAVKPADDEIKNICSQVIQYMSKILYILKT